MRNRDCFFTPSMPGESLAETAKRAAAMAMQAEEKRREPMGVALMALLDICQNNAVARECVADIFGGYAHGQICHQADVILDHEDDPEDEDAEATRQGALAIKEFAEALDAYITE